MLTSAFRSLFVASLWLATSAASARAQTVSAPAEQTYPADSAPPSVVLARQPRPPAGRMYLGFDGMTGMPFDGARGNGGGWAWGFGFKLAGSYANWPVSLGADFAFSYFGTLRGTLPNYQDGEHVETPVRRRDKVLFFDTFVRLQPATWKVRPYLEGVAGFKVVNGEYTVGALPADDDNTTVGVTHVVRTLGVGAGIELTLSNAGGARVYLTSGARWLHGGDVPYEKTVARGDQTSSISAKFSTTTTLFTLGIAVEGDVVSAD